MDLLSNSSFVANLSKQLIAPKPSHYNLHQLIQNIQKAQNNQLKCHQFEVTYGKNNDKNSFKAYHMTKKDRNITSCIVYLHGLSSYSLQGQFLLSYLPKNFSLCLYDLRGHGKNTQGVISYGINEAKDLYFLIERLKQEGIKQFYLWGRSMGAGTILNFLKIYGKDASIIQSIKYVVIDSAYSSFESIALQTAQKNYGIPRIIGQLLIGVLFNKTRQQTKSRINFNTLDFGNLHNVSCPAVFVYSQNDQVISYSNTIKIMDGYGGQKHKVIGQFLHNDLRSRKIVKEIMNIICENKQNRNSNGHGHGQKKGLSIMRSPKNAEQLNNRIPKQRSEKKFNITFTKASNKQKMTALKENRLNTSVISMSIKSKLHEIIKNKSQRSFS